MDQIENNTIVSHYLTIHWETFKKDNEIHSTEIELILIYQFIVLYTIFRKICQNIKKIEQNQFNKESEKQFLVLFNNNCCDHAFKFDVSKNSFSITLSASIGKIKANYIMTERLLKSLIDELKEQDFNSMDELILEIYSLSSQLNRNSLKMKKEKGQFNTPMPITNALSEEVLAVASKNYNLSEISILDSSCGIGNFLMSCFDSLSSKLQMEKPSSQTFFSNLSDIVHTRLFGFDSDTLAIIICNLRLLLRIIKFHNTNDIKWELIQNFHSNIVKNDFLFEKNIIKPTILIGNPPWGSVKQSEYKNNIKKHFNLQGGQIDLYRLFLELIITSDPAYICLITPDSWLEIPGAEKLKRTFLNNRKFKEIFILPATIFPVSVHQTL